MIQAIIKRHYYPDCTLSTFDMEELALFSVELPWLGNEEFKSCIPENEYICKRVDSPKYGDCFEVTCVKDREHVLFHIGNWSWNSTGCICLGLGINLDLRMVTDSELAMRKFMFKLDGINEFALKVTHMVKIG